MHLTRTPVLLVAVALILTASLAAAPTTAPSPNFTVIYPGNLEDENGKPFKQPVLIEMHLVLTPALRAEQLAPLEAALASAPDDLARQKIQTQIENLRKADALIAASQTLSPGGFERFGLPLGDYEIHFIPVNPAGRNPAILRMTHQNPRTVANVQIAPAGAIIGGDPTLQELQKKIESQQSQITALNERLQKLEKQK